MQNETLITFDDFANTLQNVINIKIDRWIEIAYREYTDGILTDKTPLNVAILTLAPMLSNTDQVKNNVCHIDVK